MKCGLLFQGNQPPRNPPSTFQYRTADWTAVRCASSKVIVTATVTAVLILVSLGPGRVQLPVARAVPAPTNRIFRRLLISELHALFCFWHFDYFLFLGLLFFVSARTSEQI